MTRRWSAVRTPAFWFLLAVTGFGTVALLAVAVLMLFFTPRATAVMIPLTLGYGALWVAVLLRVVDPVERRPAWLVAAAVAWGGTAAAGVGGGSGYFLDSIVARAVSPTFAAQWGAALVAPTAEEAAKAAGVVMIVLAARPYVTTAWSGAMYGALVGVGFAVTEDAGYGVLYADMALPDDVTAAVRVALLRFLVPGFVGHPLFTAAAGAGIAYAWLRTGRSRRHRLGVLGAALFGAWSMHFVVNSPLAAGAAEALAGLGDVAGWAGYLLAITAAAVPVLWWLAWLRRHDALVVLRRAAFLAPAALPEAEVPALAGLRSRPRASRVALVATAFAAYVVAAASLATALFPA